MGRKGCKHLQQPLEQDKVCTKELKITRSAEKKELLGEAVVCRSRMEKGTPQTLVTLSGKKARRGTSPRGLLAEEEQLSIKKFRTARS